MKLRYIKSIAAIALLTLGMTSCEDFLDRPNEDGYNTGNYYQTDEQCYAGVNYLYNSPWYDFQRGFIFVGEGLSGNYRQGDMSTTYINFTLNGTDDYLALMSASLWSVIAHSTQVYNNLKNASGPSEAVKDQCMGECLVWKALAYFFLVRSFGEVPIIHDGSQVLADGSYTNIQKTKRADVYEYIIMTLEKAMEMLPKRVSTGRLDYYSAEGLLAKTYLTKAGVSGSLNKEDLDKAASYARDVIQNSSYELESNYEERYEGFDPKSSESYIIFELMQDKNMEQSVNFAKLVQQQFKSTAGRVNKGVYQAGTTKQLTAAALANNKNAVIPGFYGADRSGFPYRHLRLHFRRSRFRSCGFRCRYLLHGCLCFRCRKYRPDQKS